MDLNVKIIEAVKKCPMLYKTNASLAERQIGWQKIAKQMQVHEQFIKTRWHFLRERYQRECQNDEQQQRQTTQQIGQQFIYKKEMEFLLPHIRTNNTKFLASAMEEVLPENVIKPEFIITENDLQDESEVEEFVFLEVEALENVSGEDEPQQEIEPNESEIDHSKKSNTLANITGQTTLKTKIGNVCTTENKENEIELKSVSEPILVSAEHKELQKELKKALEDHKEAVPVEVGTNDMKIKTEFENLDEPMAEKLEKQSTDEEMPEKLTTKTIVPRKQLIEEEDSTDEHRSEDIIFGELVSAMLRRMPAEKKRAIKKDIMNLLLT